MKLDFDIIKKSFTKAAIKTKETSENMVEIAKLKYKIAEIKSDIDDNYKKIGKLVYNADEDADISEEIAAVCTEIAELSEKMNDMQENLNVIQNKKQCPDCGMKLDKDFEFCPKCGYKFLNDVE